MLGAENSKSKIRKAKHARVLIVEDDPGLRRTIEQCLKKIGIKDVEAVEDGLAAWKKIEPTPHGFDLVISDWNMPFVTGIELLEHIRDQGIRTPFIMITAKGTFDAAIEAKDAGVTVFMPKPFTVQHLNSKVSEVLGSQLQTWD